MSYQCTLDVILKQPGGEISIRKASQMNNVSPKKKIDKQHQELEKKKLLNVVYDRGQYYVHEPSGDSPISRDPDVMID